LTEPRSRINLFVNLGLKMKWHILINLEY